MDTRALISFLLECQKQAMLQQEHEIVRRISELIADIVAREALQVA